MRFNLWDIPVLIGVSAQATAIAYVYHPKWKALLYSVPIPFTLATLSLGTGVGVTNVTGLLLLLGYGHGVRLPVGKSTWISPKRSFTSWAHSKLSMSVQWKWPRMSAPSWIAPRSSRSFLTG